MPLDWTPGSHGNGVPGPPNGLVRLPPGPVGRAATRKGASMGLRARFDGRFGRRGRRLRATAREAFGWRDLRPGQQEAMEQLLAGRDVLLVMPTGAGKSAVYQVPAQLRDGPT